MFDVYDPVNLRCAACWFDTFICCNMIATVAFRLLSCHRIVSWWE